MDEKQTQTVFNVLSLVLVALLVFDFVWVIRSALSVH